MSVLDLFSFFIRISNAISLSILGRQLHSPSEPGYFQHGFLVTLMEVQSIEGERNTASLLETGNVLSSLDI